MGILALLLAVMIIQRAVQCRRKGEPFLDMKTMRFFEPGWDKVKLFGSVVLFPLYIRAMEMIGFLAASIIFVFLYSVLYYGVEKLREIPAAIASGKPWASAAVRATLGSLAISVIFSTAVWYLFGRVFQITLP
jgi:hypothetical protein